MFFLQNRNRLPNLILNISKYHIWTLLFCRKRRKFHWTELLTVFFSSTLSREFKKSHKVTVIYSLYTSRIDIIEIFETWISVVQSESVCSTSRKRVLSKWENKLLSFHSLAFHYQHVQRQTQSTTERFVEYVEELSEIS